MKRKLFNVTLFIFIVYLFLGENKTYALQIDSVLNGLQVESKWHYGFVYPHYTAIQYILNNNMSGVEITLSTKSTGRNLWAELYRQPRYGIGYNYNDLRNAQVLGKAHSIFGYFEAPFYRSQSRFNLNYHIGYGIALFSKSFDKYDNPLNLAISSKLNLYISFDLIARFKFTRKNEIKAALELSHYSNGKTKSPNLGINAVSASVAWIYSLRPERKPPEIIKAVDYKKHITEVFWNFGGKRDDLLNDKVYLISSIVADYNYAISPKYSFGGGVDFLYDESLGVTKEHRGLGLALAKDNYQAGIHLGLRARYGKLNVILHGGHYIYATFKKYTPIYSRLGLRYNLTEHIILNMTLKAHYAIADFLEWGIGYRFNSAGI